jgi:hypothetical protein
MVRQDRSRISNLLSTISRSYEPNYGRVWQPTFRFHDP